MAQAAAGPLLRHVRKLLAAQDSHAAPDRVLLQRFVGGREEAAFAALVQRYGPLVLGVCRRVLGHDQDAEDAFQATFLVLARRAGSIRKPDALASWLYGTAYRIAAKARAGAARRRAGERGLPGRTSVEPADSLTWGELRVALDEELHRLPERYRAPLVLCYLDGKTQDEAARQLGWTPGSVKGRLERGRLLLRDRLTRRGITLSAALLGVALAEQAARAAAVPAPLAAATVRAALAFAAGTEAVGTSAAAVALAEGVVKAAAPHAKLGLLLFLTATAAVVGAGALAHQVPGAKPPEARQEAAAPAAPPEQSRRRIDRYGDPLPERAVARLGTLRLRHGGGADFVRFTPDGKLLVSHGDDGVRMWEVATGRQLSFLPRSKDVQWETPALAPDGKRLALAGEAGIRLWELPDGKPIATFARHPYLQVCFSPDGKFLAALRSDQSDRVELLEAATGREVWSWSAGRQWQGCVAFAPDGKTVITAGWNTVQTPPLKDNAVHILDVATGTRERQLDLATDSPHKMCVSPDGALLAVLGLHQEGKRRLDSVRVWEVASGRERFRLEPPSKEGGGRQRFFSALTFTPDSKSLITSGGEDGLVVWDMATGKEQRQLGRVMTFALNLAVAPDGRSVAVAHAAGWVRLIDWQSGKDLLSGAGPLLGLNEAAFAADGRTVVTIDPVALRTWDGATGQEKARFDMPGRDVSIWNYWYMLTRDGRTALAMKYQEKLVIVYDAATGKERSRLSLAFAGEVPRVWDATPGGELLAVGAYKGDTLHLVNPATGRVVRSLHDPGRMAVRVDFSADGRTLAVFRDDYTLQMWEVATGARLGHCKLPNSESSPPRPTPMPIDSVPYYQAALSPDGRWGAFQSRDENILVFDTASGQELFRIPTASEGGVFPLAFSKDGRTLGWAGQRGKPIHLVEVATGKERLVLPGHRGPTRCLSFSADGKALVSGGHDTTGLVWDLTGGAMGGKAPAVADLGGCWAALAGDDAARTYQAEWQLAAAPEQAVAYLRARLHPAVPVDEKRVAGWIADLNSDQFTVRAKATRELEKLGPAATPACRDALDKASSAEARHRLEALLDRQARELRTPSGDTLRALRALEVLERIGTPAARSVVASVAQGVPDARLTQEAQATLQRLTKPAAR